MKMNFSKQGQVAVIIIFIIAIVLIFLAVVMNLGRVALLKNVTTIAANAAASTTASSWTSWAQAQYVVSFKGGDTKEGADDDLAMCGPTQVVSAILALIIIAWIVLSKDASKIVLLDKILAIGGSLLGLTILIVKIEPGISDLWSRLLNELPIQQQFVENGLRTALQDIVDDNVQIPDTIDIDQDGQWTGNNSNEFISRFGFYYTRRLQEMTQERGDADVLKKLLNVFEQFLYEAPRNYVDPDSSNDNWGFWDPPDYSTCGGDLSDDDPCCFLNGPSECNPCCLPNGFTYDPNAPPPYNGASNQEPNLRPSCCDAPNTPEAPSCGTVVTCPHELKHPYIYDPLFENRYNTFLSFREFLGRDDESRILKNEVEDDLDRMFRKTDATGMYHQLWDLNNAALGQEDPLWCDACRLADLGQMDAKYCDPMETRKLILPEDCSGLTGRGGCCVTYRNFEVYVDRVPDPPNMDIAKLNPPASAAQCYGNPSSKGWWKEGADQFCSASWPYNENCPGKHCPASCSDPCWLAPNGTDTSCLSDDVCPANIGTRWPSDDGWPNDEVDTTVYGMNNFLQWANETSGTDLGTMTRIFMHWYLPAMRFIAPDRGGNAWLENGQPVGYLAKLKLTLTQWVTRLTEWRNANNYVGKECSDVCFPKPTGNCPGITGPRPGTATIPQVTQCLDTNALLEQDNADKLKGCYEYCTNGTIPEDNTIPTISNIALQRTSINAVITWNTDELSNSQVRYGTSPSALNLSAQDPFYKTEHTITLTGLLPGTRYYYRILSRDIAGNLARSATLNFLTAPATGYRVSTGVSTVNIGDTINVNWTAPAGHATSDWVALYFVGAPKNASQQRQGVTSAGSGIMSFLTSSLLEGVYEIRYYSLNGSEPRAVSNRIEILNSVDSNPPVISDVKGAFLTETMAIISWRTNERSTSQVRFGRTPSYGLGSPPQSNLVVEHSVTISNLTRFQTYHFQVLSRDAAGNLARSADFLLEPGLVDIAYCPEPPAPPMNNPTADCQPGSNYMDRVYQMYKEAINSKAKLEFRRDFLNNLYDETQITIDGLNTAIQKIDSFINGPEVDAMITEHKRLEDADDEKPLPGFLIYGWRSDPPKGRDRGYWHIVRADVKAPGVCNGECGRVTDKNPQGHEPGVPWITRWTENLSTKQCFALVDSRDYFGDGAPNEQCNASNEYDKAQSCYVGGTAKARVVRYDEDRDLFNFANQSPLWRFQFFRPASGAAPQGLVARMEAACGQGSSDPNSPQQSEAPGAFMLNDRKQTNDACMSAVGELLERGVTSYSCAEYFYRQNREPGQNRGFGIKFVRCRKPITDPLR